MITLSIDVTQLDKERFKTITRKNGKKAIFCDLILIDTPNGEFGDYMVKQSTTKEERAAKVEMPILGNAREVVPVKRAVQAIRQAVEPEASDYEEDIPF